MLTIILILLIFNTGMNLVLILSATALIKEHQVKAVKTINYNTDKDVETALTAIYNMDSLKQKAEMGGEVEIP